MAEDKKLVAQMREESGSGSAGRLRRAGVLPGVVNCTSGEVWSIQMNMHEFEQRLRHHVGETLLLDLEVEGKDGTLKALLKDVQHHPITGGLVHVDFVEISMTEKLTINVQVELVGECAGVNAGGVLDQTLREVEVECLPTDLIESLTIDVSALEIGDHLTVGDLVTPPGIVVTTSPEISLCAVAAPRVEEEPVEGEEGEESAEPAVVGEEAKSEGEGEG